MIQCDLPTHMVVAQALDECMSELIRRTVERGHLGVNGVQTAQVSALRNSSRTAPTEPQGHSKWPKRETQNAPSFNSTTRKSIKTSNLTRRGSAEPKEEEELKAHLVKSQRSAANTHFPSILPQSRPRTWLRLWRDTKYDRQQTSMIRGIDRNDTRDGARNVLERVTLQRMTEHFLTKGISWRRDSCKRASVLRGMREGRWVERRWAEVEGHVEDREGV